MSPARLDLGLHAVRICTCIAGLALAASTGSPWYGAGAGLAGFLAAFALAHDLTHAALGLPRRWREPLLAAAAQLMLISGHAMRVLHMRHHRRPFACDDVEGAVAHRPLHRAVAALPRLTVALRVDGYRAGGAVSRRWQRLETAANAAMAAAACASGNSALIAAVLTAIAAQVTVPVWAGRLPHAAPAWMTRAARALAFTRSPTALSLAYHDLHHAQPQVPCQRLDELARRNHVASRRLPTDGGD